jgi:protein SCO1/2
MRDLRQPEFDPNALLLAAAIGLVLLLATGFLFAQPLPAGRPLEPRAALEVSQQAIGKTLGDWSFIDRDGKATRLAAWRGRPLVVQFVYTGCIQVCPTTTKFLGGAVAEAQRILGVDAFRVVTVGFNLPFDSPEAMREFQRKQGIALPNWTFVAGDTTSVAGLARDTGFVWAPTASGFDHLTQATIVDGEGRVFRQVYGDAFELPVLVGPLTQLAGGTTAPAPSLAGILERVRILCTVYDPRAGRYRLDYALFIEIGAGLTVLGATAAFLIVGRRRAQVFRRAA